MSAAAATGVIAIPATPADQMRVRADLPDAVREALLPHEHVVWAQRGQGFRWPLVYVALPLLQVAFLAFAAYLFILKSDMNVAGLLFMSIFLIVVIAITLLVNARIVFGPPSETYVLTNLRVIHCNAFLAPVVRSLTQTSVTGHEEFLMTHIAAWGRRDRGWLMLRTDSEGSGRLTFTAHPPITSLVGVARPLELAALVKTTLKLDFEIEDHTRP